MNKLAMDNDTAPPQWVHIEGDWVLQRYDGNIIGTSEEIFKAVSDELDQRDRKEKRRLKKKTTHG